MPKNSKIIAPVFDEWWQKGPIVAANQQQVKDVRLAFYAGIWVALGLVGRANRMEETVAIGMVREMMAECDAELKKSKIKVTATINGEPLN